ncbi:SDR family NAD(P)-dependent oxidoreductase, partial [Pantoea ananatis]
MDTTWDNKVKALFNLEGKVAVITGGAGALGEGVARGLANYGVKVAVTGRTIATLEKTVQQVQEAGGEALAIAGDMTDEVAVKALADQVVAVWGKVDFLINIAGIAIRHPAEAFDVNDFRKVMDVNIT